MSTLMTNIRKASIPLQESSRQLGSLLLSLGQAADSSLDAESLAALEKSAEEAARAAGADTTRPAATSDPGPVRPAGESDQLEGSSQKGCTAPAPTDTTKARSSSACTIDLESSSHGKTSDEKGRMSPEVSAATAAPAAAAAVGADATGSISPTSSSRHTFAASMSSLMQALSPSGHSTTSSFHAETGSAHGSTNTRGAAVVAASTLPGVPAQADTGSVHNADSTDAAAAGDAPDAASASAVAQQAAPSTGESKPSPDRPMTWHGFGAEADSNQFVLCESRALAHLFTRIRNRSTPPDKFKFYARRMMRILAEEGIACLESSRRFITTPTAATFSSVYVDETNVCVVSILRAGDALAEAVQECLPHAPVGKILIQRDEASKDKHPVLYYKKFPPKISHMQVLLCDPMLATGGSALMAIRTLVEAGVQESRIVFVTVVVCPEGLGALRAEFPDVTIVTGALDDCLDERRYILPGLGDFGDRFFGTVP